MLNLWKKLNYGLCSSVDLSEKIGEYIKGYRVVKKIN